MKIRTMTCAIVGAALSATSAHAATAIVDGIGGPLIMNSGNIGDAFDSESPNLSDSDLETLHEAIQSDIGQGGTNSKVTMILLDSGTNGLSFAALVDDPTGMRGEDAGASLELNTDAPTSATAFINDSNEDIQQSEVIGDRETRGGMFNWDPDGGGDGFVWGDLDLGDFLGFSFSETDETSQGLMGSMTFQFASFEGGEWDIVASREFTQEEQYAFSLTVIPTPMAASAGALGLLGLGAMRRRRL